MEYTFGKFYWVIPALDPDALNDWEHEEQPARYCGKTIIGEDLWLCFYNDKPDNWDMRWVGNECK